jgi:hypothetical protein
MKRHSALKDFFKQTETAATRAQLEADVRAIAREIARIKKLKNALVDDLIKGKLADPECYFDRYYQSNGTAEASSVMRVLEMDVDQDMLAHPTDYLAGSKGSARSASNVKSDVAGASVAVAQLCAASLVNEVTVVPGPTHSLGAPVPETTTYRFSPYVFGRPQGPFQLILSRGNPRKRRA